MFMTVWLLFGGGSGGLTRLGHLLIRLLNRWRAVAPPISPVLTRRKPLACGPTPRPVHNRASCQLRRPISMPRIGDTRRSHTLIV